MLALMFLLYLPLTLIAEGWTLSVVWGWFMPQAFGLQPLSIPIAIGLGLVAAALRSDPWRDTEKLSLKQKIDILATPYYKFVAILGIGWIVKHWL